MALLSNNSYTALCKKQAKILDSSFLNIVFKEKNASFFMQKFVGRTR